MKQLVFTCLLLAFTGAFAQDNSQSLQEKLNADPQNVEVLVNLAIVYHDQGVAGDKKAVGKSAKLLTQALELDKENSLALAYLGSVYTLKGRDALSPQNQMSHVETGVDKLDKAVDMTPDDLMVRVVRATNSMHLPAMFHRLQYSLKDFIYIVRSKKFQHWPLTEQSMVYYNFGLALEKDKNEQEAIKNFELAKQVAPESSWAEKATAKVTSYKNSN